jgi:hypothetical protein
MDISWTDHVQIFFATGHKKVVADLRDLIVLVVMLLQHS